MVVNFFAIFTVLSEEDLSHYSANFITKFQKLYVFELQCTFFQSEQVIKLWFWLTGKTKRADI